MRPIRTSVLPIALGAVVMLTLGSCGAKPGASTQDAAKNYPSKPFTIVVESTPGSPVDVMARQIGKYSKKYLGQTAVVENKSAGDGATQLQTVKSSPADGYVLGTATRSLMTSFNTTLKGKYSVDDFTFVSQIQTDPYVIAVNSSSNIRSLDDLIKAAKKNPKYSLGGFGAGSAFSLFTDQLGKQAGFKPNYVPFDGGAAAVTAVLGNQVDSVVTNVSNVAQQVKAKKLRVLAVSSASTDATLGSGVPTFKSLGYKNMVLGHWRGIFVKKGTPGPVVTKLDTGLKKMMQDPGFQKYMTTSGLAPSYLDTADFQKKVSQDVVTTGKQLAGH